MRRLFVLCGAIGLMACNHVDDPGINFTLPPTDANVAGTFVLQSANGQIPPYTAIDNAVEIWTLVDDRIVIQNDQTWADTTDYVVQEQADGTTGPITTASSGTYAISNGQINFTMTVGGTSTFAGSVVNDSLSVLFQGKLYRYAR